MVFFANNISSYISESTTGNKHLRVLGNGVVILQEATIEGANFVFGYPPSDDTNPYRSLLETFAFGVLPYIIVMACISAILWYWGIFLLLLI